MEHFHHEIRAEIGDAFVSSVNLIDNCDSISHACLAGSLFSTSVNSEFQRVQRIKYIKVDDHKRNEYQECVNDLKKGKSKEVIKKVEAIIDSMPTKDVILACSEFSMISADLKTGKNIIDAMELLAECIVKNGKSLIMWG